MFSHLLSGGAGVVLTIIIGIILVSRQRIACTSCERADRKIIPICDLCAAVIYIERARRGETDQPQEEA